MDKGFRFENERIFEIFSNIIINGTSARLTSSDVFEFFEYIDFVKDEIWWDYEHDLMVCKDAYMWNKILKIASFENSGDILGIKSLATICYEGVED